MTRRSNSVGIVIVSHGSPKAGTNEAFMAFVQRVASRLNAGAVEPAFMSLGQPNIAEQVTRLAESGVKRIAVMPYFLYRGQHVSSDIPRLLDECRARCPDVAIELLESLENEPALEDILVERLTPFASPCGHLPSAGEDIERQSQEIIDRRLQSNGLDPAAHAIVRRVIHSTADFSFAGTMRIHPEAVRRGTGAIRLARPVICDVRMLQAGITKAGVSVLCGIGEPEVREIARSSGGTRAAAAMEKFSERFPGSIVAIGNAPTALWKVMEIAARGGPRPALVVGTPVGFVGAREAKQALLESDLCYVTNIGPRGGSPVAAAVVNALALLERERTGEHA